MRFFKALKRAAKRFIRNTPSNHYEKIVFDAVRSTFMVFGEVHPV